MIANPVPTREGRETASLFISVSLLTAAGKWVSGPLGSGFPRPLLVLGSFQAVEERKRLFSHCLVRGGKRERTDLWCANPMRISERGGVLSSGRCDLRPGGQNPRASHRWDISPGPPCRTSKRRPGDGARPPNLNQALVRAPAPWPWVCAGGTAESAQTVPPAQELTV